jgi:hypothetical protein
MSELNKIPALAHVDHRHVLDKSGKPFFLKHLTRNERRQLKKESAKISKKYETIIRSFYTSGVGFPVDQMTRQMAIEYTHRYASSGTRNMPVSFNYFEPFLNIKLINGSVAPYT